MKIQAIRYILPNGRREHYPIEINDDLQTKYLQLMKEGLQVELEQLRTGQWSVTLTDNRGDWGIEICNSHEQLSEITSTLIRKFNLDNYMAEKNREQKERVAQNQE